MVEELCRQSSALPGTENFRKSVTLFAGLVDAEVDEDAGTVERWVTSEAGAGNALLAESTLVATVGGRNRLLRPLQLPAPGAGGWWRWWGRRRIGKAHDNGRAGGPVSSPAALPRRASRSTPTGIAAVDQLRTSPRSSICRWKWWATRDMRGALARLADLDLVLMDAAGRGPRDDLKLQELKSLLEEWQADEVRWYCVPWPAARPAACCQRFSQVGASALIVTKLDEVAGLGGLLPLLRSYQGCRRLRLHLPRPGCPARSFAGGSPQAGQGSPRHGGGRGVRSSNWSCKLVLPFDAQARRKAAARRARRPAADPGRRRSRAWGSRPGRSGRRPGGSRAAHGGGRCGREPRMTWRGCADCPTATGRRCRGSADRHPRGAAAGPPVSRSFRDCRPGEKVAVRLRRCGSDCCTVPQPRSSRRCRVAGCRQSQGLPPPLRLRGQRRADDYHAGRPNRPGEQCPDPIGMRDAARPRPG